jgi:hypothetical protein
MRKEKGESVEEIIQKLDPKQKTTANKLRAIAKKTIPYIEEKVKWGNITFLLNGKNLSWIIIYTTHIDFGFFRGAELQIAASRRLRKRT